MLGVQPLDVDGRDLLADLARERGRQQVPAVAAALTADLRIEIARQLLRQGAGALSCQVTGLDVGQRGAADPPQVDAPVFEEPPVFDGDESVLHRLRDLVVAVEEFAVFLGILPQQASFGRVDLGHALGLEGLQFVNVGQVVIEEVVYYTQTDTVQQDEADSEQGHVPEQGHVLMHEQGLRRRWERRGRGRRWTDPNIPPGPTQVNEIQVV